MYFMLKIYVIMYTKKGYLSETDAHVNSVTILKNSVQEIIHQTDVNC